MPRDPLKWAKVSGIVAVIAILTSGLFFLIQQANGNAADGKVEALTQQLAQVH